MAGAQHTFGTPGEALRAQRAKEREVREAIFLAQGDSANATLRVVSRNAPVDRGEYKAGLEVHRMRAKKETRLEANAPHSGVLETGARPFWPPLAPLVEWAKRKAGDLGIVNVPAGKRFGGTASLTAAQSAEAENFARAVQRAIARRGLPARYPMRNALPFAMKALDKAFIRHLRRIAREPSRGRP
jgi:hypothetical protein